MQTKGTRRNTGSPSGDRQCDQPATPESQAGPPGAERPVVCAEQRGVYGNVGGTTTQNAVDVVVSPDILIRELWGEANTQAATGDQVSELAVGSAIRQRFGDKVYFSHFNNYQDMNVGPYNQGFDGLSRCARDVLVRFNTQRRHWNAAYIFGGISTPATDVADSKCFVSPDPHDWTLISTASQSSTTVFPGPLDVRPTCWGPTHRQLVYKASLDRNVGYNTPVPAFIFEQWRDPSWPAVIQIQ
jgi:ribosomal protein L39E